MLSKKTLIALFATVFIAISASASVQKDYIFNYFSTEDGLPRYSIYDIFQDSRGFIWLSTRTGFSRYDGNGFINFSMMEDDRTGVSRSIISNISEDASGFLWIKTDDGIVCRFDPFSEEMLRLPEDIAPSLSGNNVTAFLTGADGTVWFACEGSGLHSISPSLELTSYPDLRAKQIRKIFQSSSGIILIVSEDGLSALYNGKEIRISRNNDYFQMVEYGGYVWFMSKKELIGSKANTDKRIHISSDDLGNGNFSSLTVSNEMYIGLSDGAIARVDSTDFTCKVLKYDMGHVKSLFPDPDGLVWIETDRTGIFSWNPKTEKFKHYGNSQSVYSDKDSKTIVVHGKQNTWIKMNGCNLGWYDRSEDEIMQIEEENPSSHDIKDIHTFIEDNTGNLWVAMRGKGIAKISAVERKVDLLSFPVKTEDGSPGYRTTLCDSKGRTWFSTQTKEVFVCDSKGKVINHFPDKSSGEVGVVYCFAEDNMGNIWMGTKGNGLIRAREERGGWKFTHFTHDPQDEMSLASDDIYAIEQDKDGRIWIGSYGMGISVLANPDATEFYNAERYFPDYPINKFSKVRSIFCSEDNTVFVGTTNGLIWFKPKNIFESTEFSILRNNSDGSHSIESNDIVKIFADNNDRIWMCTFGGGLNALDFVNDQPQITSININKGLNSNIVLSASADKDNDIWIATGKGLSCYLQELDYVENFTTFDGIPPVAFREGASVETQDSCLVFVGMDKIIKFNPWLVQKVTAENPKLTIARFYVNGKRLPVNENLTVMKGYYYFRIVPSSLDFTKTDRNDLMYRLKGHENEWISQEESDGITYSRIKPGIYTFQACVKDDLSSIVSIPVTIKATFFQSLFFKIIAILLAVIVCLIFVALQYSSYKLKNKIDYEKDMESIKTRFFTNVSHELRTPLTLIVGGIEELRKVVPESDKTNFSLSIVSKNAKRMLSLVNQMLDIKQITSGNLRLVVSRMDIVTKLSEVFNDFKDTARERHIEYRFTRSTDSLLMWADATRIEALIYNLLSNAFKYTKDGGQIELILHKQDSPSSITIEVRDNGVGIPHEYQSNIFKEFFRTGVESENGVQGNGVGLAFCKEIVDFHNGSIWVESRESDGSRFYVTLPINKGHFNPDSVIFSQDEMPEEKTEREQTRFRAPITCPEDAPKMLFVEDDSELRLFMFNNLASSYNVKDAFNGQDALEILERGWVPDIIVTDLMMPVMDGMQLIKRVRENKVLADIPVIVLTAKSGEEANKEATTYGVDNYLVKPVTPDLLIAKVENLLARKKKVEEMISDRKAILMSEGVEITDRDEETVKKVAEWLEDNYANPEVTIDMMAQYVGMGRTSLYNKIKSLTAKSPVELLLDYRMAKATVYLKSGQCSVSETCYKVGFCDPGYFSRAFKKNFGMTPAEYAKKNRDQ